MGLDFRLWGILKSEIVHKILGIPFAICHTSSSAKMANSSESNPLLPKQEEVEMKIEKKSVGKNIEAPVSAAISVGWTADGLPVAESTTERTRWDSGLLSCLGRNDEFCSSDLEVCEYSVFFSWFFFFCIDT